jgi:uncharacterized protein (DUF58 family)
VLSPRFSSEGIKKIRQLELTTRRLLDDVMSGGYRSSFKGQGVQFSEHRLYVPGDDVRHIDWKVSARTRDVLVKKYEEERELNVLLVVDTSASQSFGSVERLKSEASSEVAGMLAFAAALSGDKVGMVLFSSKVEKVLPPKKGKANVSRLLKELMSHSPKSKETDLSVGLDAAGQVMKHKGIIVVVSDFLAEGYDVSLKRLARKHDVVAIQVQDRLEKEWPSVGFLQVMDPETGVVRTVDTGSYLFKRWVADFMTTHATDRDTALKSGKTDHLVVDAAEDMADALVRFFRARARRRSR